MNDELKDILTRLVQANVDSARGFAVAAENVTDLDCLMLFRHLKDERSIQALQLQDLLAAEQEFPAPTGTLSADAHRLWIKVRGTLSDRDEAAVLPEVAKSESHLRQEYEAALPVVAGTDVAELVRAHYENVSTTYQHLAELATA